MKLNNRDELKVLRSLLNLTLGTALTPHQLFAELGSIKYSGDGSECHMKLTIRAGDATTFQQESFNNSVRLHGHRFPWLMNQHYGMTFTQKGEEWKLYGLESRRRGPTFLAKKVSTGKSYRIPESWVSDAVMRQHAERSSGVRKRRNLEIA